MLKFSGKSFLNYWDLYSSYALRKSGFLKESGWFRSFREAASIDRDGKPIPWITYAAIDFLDRRLSKNMSLFEYGCGASTLWFAQRVKEVISCEHDRHWYEKIKQQIPDNVQLFYIELNYGGDYAQKITDYTDQFDIVFIDGRDRTNCITNSIQALKPTGVIVFDNSDREKYSNDINHFMTSYNFRKLEFTGMVPGTVIKSETGIFYRAENCLGI